LDYCRLLYTLCVLLGLCLLLLLRVNLRLLQLLLYLTDDSFDHHPVRSVKGNGGEGKRKRRGGRGERGEIRGRGKGERRDKGKGERGRVTGGGEREKETGNLCLYDHICNCEML